MDETMKFDYYYGLEAEQFSFYRIPRLLIRDEHFRDMTNDAKLPIGGSLMYSLGILSIDLILGGLVGGIIVIIKAVMIVAEIIRMIVEMITGKTAETVSGIR